VNPKGRLGNRLQGVVPGYLAVPATHQGVGILLFQEQASESEQTQEVCEQLARAGFVALAPDCSPQELSLKAGQDQVEKAFAQDVERLLSEPAVNGARVGCLAFSNAAPMAFLGSFRNQRIGALALCHPVINADAMRVLKGEASSAQGFGASFLGFFLDPPVNVPGQDPNPVASCFTKSTDLQPVLGEAFASANLIQLEGVREGFMDESRPDRFDALSSRECWQRLQQFFSAVSV
jgi:dienelactone hydrolase